MTETRELVVIETFESGRILVDNFVVMAAPALSNFLTLDDAKHLAKSLTEGVHADVAVFRRALAASQVAGCLFHELQKKMTMVLFVHEIDSQLDSLEHHSFETTEVESFYQIMQQQVESITLVLSDV